MYYYIYRYGDIMSKILFKQPKWILIIATFSCFLWGSAFPSLKVGYEMLDLNNKIYSYKILFAGYRFFIASIMILGYAFMNRMIPRLSRKILLHLIAIGVLQTTIQYVLFYIGLSNTTGVKGSILIGTGTFFSLLLAHFYYHDDKLSINKVLGLIVGFSGVVIISLAKGKLDFGFQLTGEGFMILAAAVGAFSALYAKELTKELSPVIISGVQMLIGALLLIIISGNQIGYDAITFNQTSLVLLVYLAFISAVAFTLWYILIKHNKIGVISIYKFQIPIWGVVLSSIILPNETLSTSVIISLFLVVCGIILVNFEKPILQLGNYKKLP